MKARLIVNPNVCTGCRTCELACSFTHSIKGKTGFKPHLPSRRRFQGFVRTGGLSAMRGPGLR